MLFRQSTRHISLSATAHLGTSINRRTWTSTATRFKSETQSSAYREGIATYRAFVSPFAKVFLGAVFTYQVIYWCWVKLETDEEKLAKNEELATLEKKARELAAAKK
ncbi:hypothetical protein N7495_002925 [Penicillium taxi]|uniref:uncharacterized protein n=1 Tax=Penicillium taxi TaxID=168475 RepID=UPI00254562E7|nr:uncharacterized protein N7495_002925 [Penicillium taxi]KAJ5902397.1 hypothetical protein N7495_002925 [Penicillium taxi]